MPDQHINKVVYGSTTLLDLTDTTAAENHVMTGYFFHDVTGALVEGTIIDGDELGYGVASNNVVNVGTVGSMIID
jgi:hypothetical protein